MKIKLDTFTILFVVTIVCVFRLIGLPPLV